MLCRDCSHFGFFGLHNQALDFCVHVHVRGRGVFIPQRNVNNRCVTHKEVCGFAMVSILWDSVPCHDRAWTCDQNKERASTDARLQERFKYE